ncbi:MAG: hypothetical protein NC452_11630 [Eubacterium sp.]|nr:hypothetical protein [Eubacterium sp.]
MKEIQAEIRRDRIENDSRKTELQGKVSSGLKTSKSSVKAEGSNGINAKVASVLKTTAAVGSVAANMISTAMPAESGDDLSSNAANEFRENAGKVTDKSLSAVKNLAEKRIENLNHPEDTLRREISDKIKGKITSSFNRSQLGQGVQNIKRQVHNVKALATNRINNIAPVRAVRNVKNKVKRIEKKVTRNVNKIKRTVVKAIDPRRIFNKNYGKLTAKKVKKLKKKAAKRKDKAGKIKNRFKGVGLAVRGVSGTVGAASRVRNFTSDNDAGSNLAEMGKDFAAKGAELSYRAAKKVLKKPAKAVTKQVKKVGKRAVKTAVNKIKKKLAKKTAKTTVKATQRTIKTSVKAVKATAKIFANAAKMAIQAAKAAIQAAVKVGQALVELLATPVGWIILGVVLVIVLIIILFNTISGAAGATTSVVSGVGSSLSWLFGGGGGDADSGDVTAANDGDIAELYEEFEGTAHLAMHKAKDYWKDQINGISFGSRDTLVFDGTSFYPASSADGYIQSYFTAMDYDDYMYLMQMCYIKKLRDERAAQGLSENEMPEVTITESDIKSFLLNYCYEFDITIIGNQTCPGANCRSSTSTYTSYCGGGESCSNHGESGSCLGHSETETTYYCDHSHIKAVVTIRKVLKSELEDDILVLTDDERQLLNLGLDILNDAVQP